VNEILKLVLALPSGVLIGAIFFGGLWWTVKKGAGSKRPALWFFGSLLTRTTIVLAGFYLIGRDNWERLLLCLLGFIIARTIMMQITRTGVKPHRLDREAPHAP